jgi:hypothetical protein
MAAWSNTSSSVAQGTMKAERSRGDESGEGGIQIDAAESELGRDENAKKKKRPSPSKEESHGRHVRPKLAKKDVQDGASRREIFDLFNQVKAMEAEIGVELQVPEVVVVGGQSDGKCTLLSPVHACKVDFC